MTMAACAKTILTETLDKLWIAFGAARLVRKTSKVATRNERCAGKPNRMFCKGAMISVGFIALAWFNGAAAFAKDIETGRRSMGAASATAFSWTDYDGADSLENARSFDLSLEFGYFVFKNVEAGTTLTYGYMESNESRSTHLSLSPYLSYHFPLSPKVNLFTTVGAGYGQHSFSFEGVDEVHSDATTLFAELGCEYFLTDNIAFALGLKRNQTYVDASDGGNNYSLSDLRTQLRLKLYF